MSSSETRNPNQSQNQPTSPEHGSYQQPQAPQYAPQPPQYTPQPPQAPQYPTQQQYQQPQQQYQQQPYAQYPTHGAAPAQQSAPLNVFGVIALVVLGVNLLTVLVQPFIFRTFTASYGAASLVINVVTTVLLLIALVFGIIGWFRKGQDRFRWAAIGATVCAAYGLLSSLLVAASWSVTPF